MLGRIKLHNRWGFLEVDHQVGKYYRSLFYLTYGVKLQRPSNKEHITIVSPDDNLFLGNLHHFNGNELFFCTQNIPYTNSSCIWIDVVSEDIVSFRKSIGLSPTKEIGLHLAIGYINER